VVPSAMIVIIIAAPAVIIVIIAGIDLRRVLQSDSAHQGSERSAYQKSSRYHRIFLPERNCSIVRPKVPPPRRTVGTIGLLSILPAELGTGKVGRAVSCHAALRSAQRGLS
jgi:hypothetical protein